MKQKLCLLTVLALLTFCPVLPVSAGDLPDVSTLYKKKDVDAEYSEKKAELIDLTQIGGSMLTIDKKGDYCLSGSFSGQVLIDAPEDAAVRLCLMGVDITSPEGPAIYERQADKLIVTLAPGTVNTLTDGPAVTDGDDTIGAALYAEDDLSINGSGALIVNGTVKHGIQSKADLIVADGVITVTAKTDGVRGRNSVLILDGTLSVDAQGDGIVSTRDDREDKGWVIVAGGSVTVRTGGGAGEVRASANSRGGFRGNGRDGRGFGGWGRQRQQGTQPEWQGQPSPEQTGDQNGDVSQKGLKAAAALTVMGGALALDCQDDGLHAKQITVAGGTLSIQTGDDGLHADETLQVTGGTIDVARCYEGLEGKDVAVSGGTITVTASDDGINACGGGDASGFSGRGNDRFGGGAVSGSLSISGGTVSVNAGGDGLDSNGSISITGGVTGVYARTTTGEGAIDFNGTGTLQGGTLIVLSAGGVMRDTAGLTGQPVMTVSVSGPANAAVSLADGAGNALGAFTPTSAFDTAMISSDRLKEGDAFRLTVDGQTLLEAVMTDSGADQGYRDTMPGRRRR